MFRHTWNIRFCLYPFKRRIKSHLSVPAHRIILRVFKFCTWFSKNLNISRTKRDKFVKQKAFCGERQTHIHCREGRAIFQTCAASRCLLADPFWLQETSMNLQILADGKHTVRGKASNFKTLYLLLTSESYEYMSVANLTMHSMIWT
jgi:hypothetical protein